jgi:hypothetical protein
LDFKRRIPSVSTLSIALFMTSASRCVRSRRFQCLIVAMLFAALALLAAFAACAADDSTESEEQVSARIKSMLVASPYRISAHALAGRIRYEIALPDGAGLSLPETGEQHVEQRGDRLFVTLCKDLCGREQAPDAAELARYLQPNSWVDSNDRRIARFARSVPSNGPVGTRMTLLAKAVTARMSGAVEFRHYWTAREAYDKQGGDCTEFAVLLAAVARARGIPTRVVAGMWPMPPSSWADSTCSCRTCGCSHGTGTAG